MKFGVVFPQTEFGSNDPVAVRDYTQAVEALGFTHVVAYDHVIGANPERPGGWTGPYTYQSSFFEPFVLFSFMAGIAPKLGFLTGIVILPQRQTVLAAKQAATLDVLCQGKFRLGIGLGWNEVEYAALHEDFHTRGKRMEEQVELLRLLWTQPLVNFQGKWHNIPDAGLKPLPVQRPIPIWMGGTSPAALQRIARIADGWLPNVRSVEGIKKDVDEIRRGMDAVGRAHADLEIEPRIPYGSGDPGIWEQTIRAWQDAGATQYAINTLGGGFTTPDGHIAALRKFTQSVDFTPV
jgi:probable F420-dependent oxidoreductase